ncbi:MAG: HDOD domain-containing protein [Gammaproteobacteria bacterium]|nr:HDOD domain-containing protein [Gammaproteobacteria bacterium]
MELPLTIKTYLDEWEVDYELMAIKPPQTSVTDAAASLGIDSSRVIRAVLLQDHGANLTIAILPAENLIDFDAIQRLSGYVMEPAPEPLAHTVFPDCDPNAIPPFADAYELPALVDEQLASWDEVYLEPGNHSCLMRMQAKDFLALHGASQRGYFSQSNDTLTSDNDFEFVMPLSARKDYGRWEAINSDEIKKRITKIDRLPSMTEMSHRLLRIRNDPHATIAELEEIIALDPSLTAQIMRYACSPFFGYRGKVNTVHDAIVRVLGFDVVTNMALGLSMRKMFYHPPEGPLGLNNLWRHAISSAALAQSLAPLLPRSLHVNSGVAYLTALLHNFGYLVMSHLIKSEFFLLNKIVTANPDIPPGLIEKQVLGIEHTEIGAWLMEAWDMPAEVIVTAREHHNEYYRGEHDCYANLTLLVDHLLKAYGIGDGVSSPPPTQIYTALGLDENKVLTVTRRLMETDEGKLTLTEQLVA